jgi:AcrR family transcriptional regulator
VAGLEPDRVPQKLPRGRHGLPRQFVVRSQRERMLDATSRAVSELGYPALTVAAILERAGVSRKTFYEHFSDKEECFLAAYDVVVEGLVRGVSDSYNSQGQWRDKVRAGLAEFLRFLAAEPDFARMCIVEVLAAGSSALQRRDGAMRMFTVFFEAGRKEVPAHVQLPELVSESVVGAIYEIIYARILRNRTEELPDLLPDLMYIALVPYLGHEDAVRDYVEATAGRRSLHI